MSGLALAVITLVAIILAVDFYAAVRERHGSNFWSGYIDGRNAIWNLFRKR